jgi:PAS domain S-box-containing protein
MNVERDPEVQTYAHLILEHLPAGIALFDASNLHLLASNTLYDSLLSTEWQQGRSLGHTLSEILQGVAAPAEISEIIAIFRKAIETGRAFRTKEYPTSDLTRGTVYWDWALEPIFEQDQVRYVLLTVTDVTPQVAARLQTEQAHAALTRVHHASELELQRLTHVETILSSLQNMHGPKELAQSVLAAIDTCFSPYLLAFYSVQSGQRNLSLLASRTCHIDVPQEEPALTPNALDHSGLPTPQTLYQSDPVIKLKSQGAGGNTDEEKDAFLELPGVQCVVYTPLWKNRCEGVLVVAFASKQGAYELLARTLSECAPYLTEALVSTRLHATILDERKRLYTILDQLPEGVMLVEARTSKVSYVNAAAAHMLGLDISQLAGVPLNQLGQFATRTHSSRQQPEAAFHWKFALIDALWGKTISNQELTIARPDGSKIVVLGSTAVIHASSGMMIEAVIVFQDITALKQLEQQKSEFFAVANHELRTPLTIITGFSELLHMHATDESDAMYQYATTSITQECEHLLQLINEMLDVSRLEYDQLKIQKQYQDLLVPLRQTVDKYIHSTSTHCLLFTLEELQPTDRLMGWFDIPRLEQVLYNLISNAIKYSPLKSEIKIGVRLYHNTPGIRQEVLIWVEDHGIGIAANDLPHIFDRFYRADNMDRSISGFGIGLYLTKELVQEHGGHVWVESVEKQGSTFFVALPVEEIIHEA